LWGQYWKVNAGGGAVLTEDVEFEDLGTALNYNYYSLNADVDSDDWSGGLS
jgi:hypothetical protein